MYSCSLIKWMLVVSCAFSFTSCGNSSDRTDAGVDFVFPADVRYDAQDSDQLVIDASQSGIVGDWFLCANMECTKVDYRGWRIQPGGVIQRTFAGFPYLDDGEEYCYAHRAELNLTYTYVGGVLEFVTFTKRKYSYKVELGEYMVLTNLSSGSTNRYKRITPVRDKGSCETASPWICPKNNEQTGGGIDGCGWTWVCDNGDYSLSCKTATTGYECTCINANGVVDGKFTSSDVCSTAPLDGPIDLTNAKCGWQVWLPIPPT